MSLHDTSAADETHLLAEHTNGVVASPPQPQPPQPTAQQQDAAAASSTVVPVTTTAAPLSMPPAHLQFDPMSALDGLKDGARRSTIQNTSSFVPCSLKWVDLKYDVELPTKQVKHVLKGCSGQVHPGQVLAILGTSGAGKSTLLNMLAGRLSQSGNGATSGSVLVNNEPRDWNHFRQISAYVLQEDTFFAELTVRETITLSALLRLPRDMPRAEKLERVDAVLAELGLIKCQDTLVGNELVRGVSGGERKRLNIGTELVTSPSLLFVDEPTTGLDAFNAQSVMATLLSLAQSNRTVITTIHQPRSSIFQMFDKLMLMSEGSVLYFGAASDAVNYFARQGFACPPAFNPADYFLDLISYDQRSKESADTTMQRIELLAGTFREFQALGGVDGDTLPHMVASDADKARVKASEKYSASWLMQFRLLLGRSFRTMAREKANNFAFLGQTIVFSVLLGLIWLREGSNFTTSHVQALSGALFFVVVNQAFSGVFGIIFLFPAERSIVLKERSSRSYNVGAYFLSKSIAEAPRTILMHVLFCIVSYFMIDFRSGADHFFVFLFVLILSTMCSEGLALVVSAGAKDPQQAGAIAPVFIVTSMLFGGFFIGVDSIPIWLNWLRYLSFIKYGFSALMQNEFRARALVVEPGCTNFCPTTGDEVLDFYNVNDLSMASNIVILLGILVGLRLLAYIVLRLRGPKFSKHV